MCIRDRVSTQSTGDYSVAFNTAYAYNPKTNNFTRTGRLAFGRGDFASAVLDGVGYIYGGYKSDDFCRPLPVGEKFDATKGTWIDVASLTGTTADQRASATNDGRIISIGGERKLRLEDCHDWEIIPSSDVVSFLPSTNQWRNESSMPDARFRFGAAVVRDLSSTIQQSLFIRCFPLFIDSTMHRNKLMTVVYQEDR
eukprot:TRINITY_DN3013_c0_g1_i2.p1 TRINITY_DN3013_c0_g1~~TRINITY_DN3013_c0_g1_i2.p1  ORF type:complete len:197 (+),score=41.16 TRINITY_DN3013_c0_g1_i2:3-593(+)